MGTECFNMLSPFLNQIKMKPIIKYTGSKRPIAPEIVSTFPSEIETYYEPFIGGAHVLINVLKSERITAKKYVASDILLPLINFWKLVKSNPSELYKEYKFHWKKFNQNPDYYYEIRDEFNKNVSDPKLFLFLTRTCYNGLIRFNSDGEFNTSVHFGRSGIEPQSFYKILVDWHNILNLEPVEFIHRDYQELTESKKDWIYLDPPYIDTKAIYEGGIDINGFYKWLGELDAGYALSFDGKVGNEKQKHFIPDDLYDSHVLLDSSISGFRKLKNDAKRVYESLYIKLNNHEAPEKNYNKRFFEF